MEHLSYGILPNHHVANLADEALACGMEAADVQRQRVASGWRGSRGILAQFFLQSAVFYGRMEALKAVSQPSYLQRFRLLRDWFE